MKKIPEDSWLALLKSKIMLYSDLHIVELTKQIMDEEEWGETKRNEASESRKNIVPRFIS